MEYDVFLDELGDIFVFDANIGFCLHLIAEIVGYNEQKLIAMGRDPIMSILHCANDQGFVIGLSTFEGHGEWEHIFDTDHTF